MDANDAKRRRRKKRRRSKRLGPCGCPQCLMAADMADGSFNLSDLSDVLLDMDDEDFDDEDLDDDFDIEDCNDEDFYEDEDYDDYDAKRRGRKKRRRRRARRGPCSLMAADLEDDEDYDDEDNLDDEDYDDEDDDDDFMAIDDEDYDDEDDLDDEDYDEEDDYDDEDDLDDEDYDDDFMAMDDEDDYDDEDEALDVRTVKLGGCPGIKKVKVRKNRAGEEPFTSFQEERLCSAVRLAYAEARNVAAALDQIWYQKGILKTRRRRKAWRNNSAISRWFGTKILTRRQIRVTRRRVKRILKFFKRGITFVIVQQQTGKRSWLCKKTRRAYAWGGSRIFLCPSFFQDSTQARAITIIHELVHKIGWGHPRLRGSGSVKRNWGHRDRALELARRFPMRARRSPVNFAWLYNEFRPRF